MRVLFDIYHPGHVHLFRNTIINLQENNHDVLVLSREKDVTIDLLDEYGIEHKLISGPVKSRGSPIIEGVSRGSKLIYHAFKFDPDIMMARFNPLTAYVSKIVGAENILFLDSDYVSWDSRITIPMVDTLYTPEEFEQEYTSQRRIDAYHELAYLHPNWFDPDQSIFDGLKLDHTDTYFVLRFVSFEAYHDAKHTGFSKEAKTELVRHLDEIGDVFITAEYDLPEEFEEFEIPIHPNKIHSFLNYANLYVGDSQTMATEAAILGTPSVRYNSFTSNDFSNFVELEEEYGLLYSFTDEDEAISKAVSIAQEDNIKTEWERKRQNMLADKVDITSDIIQFINEM